MRRLVRSRVFWTTLVLSFSLLSAFASRAQTRLSDKDIAQRIKNLQSDTKTFRPLFNNAISKSSIRKTSQARDARNLAVTFQKSTDALYEHFKQTKRSDPYLQNTLDYARQLERIQSSVQLDPAVASQWAKIRSELDDLAAAFNLPAH